ncbi:hypothetical protein B0H11DRAFT_1938201 [Mycena galericulata]|nr:hypothetical protein B0H11DRAFT_1938201 [Mycena galericulata]
MSAFVNFESPEWRATDLKNFRGWTICEGRVIVAARTDQLKRGISRSLKSSLLPTTTIPRPSRTLRPSSARIMPSPLTVLSRCIPTGSLLPLNPKLVFTERRDDIQGTILPCQLSDAACNYTKSDIDSIQFGTLSISTIYVGPWDAHGDKPVDFASGRIRQGRWDMFYCHRRLHVLSEHLSLHCECFDLSHNACFDHPLPRPKTLSGDFQRPRDVRRIGGRGENERVGRGGCAGDFGRGEQLAPDLSISGRTRADICAFLLLFGWADLSRSGRIPAEGILTGVEEPKTTAGFSAHAVLWPVRVENKDKRERENPYRDLLPDARHAPSPPSLLIRFRRGEPFPQLACDASSPLTNSLAAEKSDAFFAFLVRELLVADASDLLVAGMMIRHHRVCDSESRNGYSTCYGAKPFSPSSKLQRQSNLKMKRTATLRLGFTGLAVRTWSERRSRARIPATLLKRGIPWGLALR